jgi:hypothetical protein
MTQTRNPSETQIVKVVLNSINFKLNLAQTRFSFLINLTPNVN